MGATVIDTNTPPGFVKLPRAILSEGWTRRPYALHLFVHLLLSANREAKTWNGVRVERGQFLTSLRSLSTNCGLSISAIRSTLAGLQQAGVTRSTARLSTRSETGGVTRSAARGYTLVTICNFDNYEGLPVEGRTVRRTVQSDTPAQSPARQPAPTKEIDINILSNVVTDARFLPIVADWLAYKRERDETYKGKKGLTAFYNRLQNLSGGDPDTARRIVDNSMANNYAGIFPEKTSTPPGGGRQSVCNTSTRPNPRISIGNPNPDDYKSTL